MVDVMKGNLPSFYPFKSFPELNLRTYVTHKGKAGVWFLSLDATSLPVVLGGRYVYGIPYHLASIAYPPSSGEATFKSKRWKGGVSFEARFEADGEAFLTQPGTFENWLTERYCFYAKPCCRGLVRVDVHHKPWPMKQANVEVQQNEVLESAGIEPISDECITHASPGVDVISFSPQAIY